MMKKQMIIDKIDDILDDIPFDVVSVANLMDFGDMHGLSGMSDDLDDHFIFADDGRVLMDKPGKPEADSADVKKVALASLKADKII